MKKIDILMSIYNPNNEYIKQSFDSIENQIYKNFRVVIVNDGNEREKIESILSLYTFEYILIDNIDNLGLTKSLNKGLSYCTAEYIARFDDDDIMDENRLLFQLEFMEKNKEIAAVFSNISVINKNGDTLFEENTDYNKILKKKLINKGNCLCHSSLFIRRNIINYLGGYDEQMIYAQDYDLILRILNQYNIYKLNKILIKFRQGSNRITLKKKFMSILCSYYATLIYLRNNPSIVVFFKRTFIVIISILKMSIVDKMQ